MVRGFTNGWDGMESECKYCKKVKGADMSENPIEIITKVRELMELHEFMEDEQLDKAMSLVVKLVINPQVPSRKAPALITELQALSTVFAFNAAKYATFQQGPARSPQAHRKNVYFSAKEAINKLVDALKYAAKAEMDY